LQLRRPAQSCLSLSYFATDGQSVHLVIEPSETHDQILAVVKTVAVLLSWGILTDKKEGLSCNRSQFLSELVIYVRFYFTRFLRVLFYILLLLRRHHLLRPPVHVLYSRLY